MSNFGILENSMNFDFEILYLTKMFPQKMMISENVVGNLKVRLLKAQTNRPHTPIYKWHLGSKVDI